ncbi:MAG: sulfurtransferase [Chloroflexi bacterium]|nr:sulfurtransferase [Chloroflexota bacterium]
MATDNGYANNATLVSTQWVAEHLNDPNVRLVEVDVDTTAYEQGHIRNAIGWNWQTQLEDTVRRDLPTKEAWERLLGNSGIGNDTKIVFYGDNNNWFAAFAYWIAKIYGHQDAALMNGGRKKWELDGRELVKEVPSSPATSYRAGEPDERLRALQFQVRDYINAPNRAMVDVRSPAEFNGEILAPPGLPETAQRAGHIPSATNVPWGLAANEDGTFKSRRELEQLYQSKGITPEKQIVAYCRIGERSSHTWFVLKELLGYADVRNYDGSWTEWGSMIGVPIENPSAQASS